MDGKTVLVSDEGCTYCWLDIEGQETDDLELTVDAAGVTFETHVDVEIGVLETSDVEYVGGINEPELVSKTSEVEEVGAINEVSVLLETSENVDLPTEVESVELKL